MDSLAICEDDSYMLDQLKKMAECYVKDKKLHTDIHTFASGEELLRENMPFDVLLLDLMLPGVNGVEVAKSFCGSSQMIFVTSYREYAVDAFDVGAVHYLVKPVVKEQLFLALDRARERLLQRSQKTVALAKNGLLERILISDILYCEVFDHQVCIHTLSGGYEYFGTLDALEEKLGGSFFRCHRSFLVNMAHIVRREKGMAVLEGGERVMISRRKQREFMQSLLSFLKTEVI